MPVQTVGKHDEASAKRQEALVNFEKKSEHLTLHGETGFIPHVLPVLPVLHALHVLQALPVLPVLLK